MTRRTVYTCDLCGSSAGRRAPGRYNPSNREEGPYSEWDMSQLSCAIPGKRTLDLCPTCLDKTLAIGGKTIDDFAEYD